MATWIVGDIHGCAAELAELVERIALGPGDRLLSVGDLFQRGPDPMGVIEILRSVRARFLLGNHELRILERHGLAPGAVGPETRPALRTQFGALSEHALDGDGGIGLPLPLHQRGLVLEFLQEHSGFFAESANFEAAGPTADGRPWIAVHAGLVPGKAPRASKPNELVSLRRLELPGRPYWYEVYSGPTLVLFGHTPSSVPRARHERGRLVALGLDTGCVYGGKLSAYSPELDRLCSVPARKAYARSH